MVVKFLIVVEPVVDPTIIAVASPAKLTEVAVVFTKLIVVFSVVISPPSISKFPTIEALPPT